jgi:hypothetical protein
MLIDSIAPILNSAEVANKSYLSILQLEPEHEETGTETAEKAG